MFQGHSIKTLLVVGSVCGAISSILTLVVGSGHAVSVAQAKADAHILKVAQAVADPIKADLDRHVEKAEKAMSPGGQMHDRFITVEQRIDWLVKERVCRIDRNTPCPPLADVLNH